MRRSALTIFGLLWAASGCTLAGFRHYDPIGNCIPKPSEQLYKCTDTHGQGFPLPFADPKVKDLVCFGQREWVAHEEACHAR
jgi:hypothetical protein